MSIFPTKILLATDGSREAQLAAKTAAGLAQETGSELHVVHVLPWPLNADLVPSSYAFEVRSRLESGAQRQLEEQTSRIEALGGEVESSHLALGRPDAEIIARAEQIGAGLIVVGSRGLGPMSRTLTGSVSESVVHHAHCPVMVVRGQPLEVPAPILVATDGSEEASLAASAAADLARTTGSELHLTYVGPMPNVFYDSGAAVALEPNLQREMEERAQEAAKSRLEELAQKIREASGKVDATHPRVGYPDAEIVGLAGRLGAGLIVVGSRGLGPLRRALMGSVSSGVVHHAHCPVMVVRTGDH